jgi:hypothetical protein
VSPRTVDPRLGSDRRKADRRQRRLHLVPADLPPIESDEPPFLRPERRTRVRRARRGLVPRVVLALEIVGGMLVALFASWGAYSKVMAAERLKVAHVEVRGGRFLSEAEVRDLLGPALGENILTLDIAWPKPPWPAACRTRCACRSPSARRWPWPSWSGST